MVSERDRRSNERSADRRGVQSFGSRQKEPEDDPTVVSLQLPPVKLTLEVDRQMLLELGDQIRETVYNAATAGLQAAVEDFAAGQGGEDDDEGGDPRDHVDDPQGPAQGPAEVTNTTGKGEPLLSPDQLRQVGDTDSR